MRAFPGAIVWWIGYALAASPVGPAVAAPQPPALLVMHADPDVPGGWWVGTGASGPPLDTLALARILGDREVPEALSEERWHTRRGRIVFGLLGGASFVAGMIAAGAVPPPVDPGAEPLPDDYANGDRFELAHAKWVDLQSRADDRDEVLTDAVVLLAGSALCIAAVPLVGYGHAQRLRYPALAWPNADAVDEIEAYNARVRASLQVGPAGARLTVEVP